MQRTGDIILLKWKGICISKTNLQKAVVNITSETSCRRTWEISLTLDTVQNGSSRITACRQSELTDFLFRLSLALPCVITRPEEDVGENIRVILLEEDDRED